MKAKLKKAREFIRKSTKVIKTQSDEEEEKKDFNFKLNKEQDTFVRGKRIESEETKQEKL